MSGTKIQDNKIIAKEGVLVFEKSGTRIITGVAGDGTATLAGTPTPESFIIINKLP